MEHSHGCDHGSSTPGVHGHGAHTPAVQFPPSEVQAMQVNDRLAAKGLVLLMTGIFTSGLLGYLLVCWWIVS